MNTSKLQSRQTWLGGGIGAAVAIVAASWFMMISPELSSADQLRSQVTDLDHQSQIVADKTAKLAEQNRHIDSLRIGLVAALNSLPPDSGLPAFTREVTSVARDQSVQINGITVGSIGPATTGAGTATQPDTSQSGTSQSGSLGSGTAAPATAPAASGEFAISVTVLSTGSLRHQIAFAKGLQDGPRRVLVNATQVTVTGTSRIGSVDATTTMTTQLTLFSAPMTAQDITALLTLLRAGS